MPNSRPFADLIDTLTYQSYAHNRLVSPHITPAQWSRIFGASTEAMEERFHVEHPELFLTAAEEMAGAMPIASPPSENLAAGPTESEVWAEEDGAFEEHRVIMDLIYDDGEADQ